MRAECGRRSRCRWNKIRRYRAFAGAEIDQIASASAGRDRIVVTFAVEEIISTLAEELVAAAGRFGAVGAEIAVDIVDGVVFAGVGGVLAVDDVVIRAAEQQIGAGVAGNQVVARAAIDGVVARAGVDGVVAGIAINSIAA